MAITTGEVIRRVKEDFVNRRGRAYDESNARKLEVYGVIPELREIDELLSSTAVRVMMATAMGKAREAEVGRIKSENEALLARKAQLLQAAGYPGDYTSVRFACDKCNDSGYVGIDMCSCLKEEIACAMIENSGIGKLAQTQSFENFDFKYYQTDADIIKKNYDALKSFADNFSKDTTDNFLLMGATGLGKTHLSTAVAVTVIKRGYDVWYDTMQNMVDAFSNTQFRGGDPDEVNRYYNSDLLIVDDLGSELTNQFTISVLYNLINQRANGGKCTIFSTNLTSKELREKYSDRITSRLLGMYYPLLFKGKDIRMQKLMEK
ncbi:MAG: ATP-binding protein [Clostridia bacterium]|nr:ATP-binding protein [Clostridia bacterium]